MPNDDLISRNDVLEIVMQYCVDDDGSCAKPNADLREMLDEVENIPAADVEHVRHGKWEIINRNRAWCSECKMIRHIGTQTGWNYCPTCGAKMEGNE